MDDVTFYDSQVQYQKRVGEIEKERLQLEREMFAMMRSDKKLQNIRAVKLRSYWKQVCGREEKARARNKELLEDFEEMEVKLSAMDARTTKLRKMKMEYDEKVKQMYPKWRQEVEVARAKRQLQERGIKVKSQKENVMPKRENVMPSYRSEMPFSYAESLSPTHGIQSELIEDMPMNVPTPSRSLERLSNPPAEIVRTPRISNSLTNAAATHPPNIPVTSTPKSLQSSENISEQASLHAPPESFADTKPKQADYVNVSSPMRTPNKTSNVIHTIPTALSSDDDDGISDVSEPSFSNRPMSTQIHHESISEKSFETPGNLRPQSTRKSSPQQNPVQGSGALSHSTFSDPASPTHDMRASLFSATTKKENQNDGQRSIDSESRSHHTSSAHSPIKYQPSPVSAVAVHASVEPKSPENKPESRLSISSFGSDDLSPRSNRSPRSGTQSPRTKAPLTASAAYQALLKQHGGTKDLDSINIPSIEEESDEDDLENLLSPHGTGKRSDFEPSVKSESDDDVTFSSHKDDAPVYIPTAVSQGSRQRGQKQQVKQRAAPKAPWDTDTEDEFENEETYLSNTGGSSKWDQKLQKYDAQDDFDFYD